ncbi:hypothetical protein Patl1_34901 [Pistacia atlantica]|uniref:Uncharacterized protein n=1 Tax=Pistacia atlantica TaxID=434234 RepID=A0ACC0ZU02_9ROSI|nr:hypothetical protein Patl1_34901 [Pistacia atlantica]
MSNSSRCAACKSLRRKCPQDCVLAPYFPSNNPQRFSWVHKIFGASNIAKMLQQLPVELRGEAADCMAMEAYLRVENPVYGSVGIIYQYQQQIIEVQNEIIKINGEIAVYNALLQHQQLQQHQDSFFSTDNDFNL